MGLRARILEFLEHPFPLWETSLTNQLVQHQWKALESQGFLARDSYSTAGCWLKNPCLIPDERKEIFNRNLYVEMPSPRLQSFYYEHGLELQTKNEIETGTTLLKIRKALSSLESIKPLYDCITSLIRCIHILRQPDAEIDLSYSHPKIPFSIFLSVCEDDSTISNLRVAESILHEAMHLKLTLIENIVPLINCKNEILCYSPWRDEHRPISGILHGLFVFRAISDYYSLLLESYTTTDVADFINHRIEDIRSELQELNAFATNVGLLATGKTVVISLLQ